MAYHTRLDTEEISNLIVEAIVWASVNLPQDENEIDETHLRRTFELALSHSYSHELRRNGKGRNPNDHYHELRLD